ncbi:MAG: hypothetical protein EOP61_08310 [Sphingomonadales bacterium]|nr:MAG: hypothetical protein EOP61_08310 [Sphingomonadales bacterium]
MAYKLQNHGKGPRPGTAAATIIGPGPIVISVAGVPIDTTDALESVIEQRVVDALKAAFADAAVTTTRDA